MNTSDFVKCNCGAILKRSSWKMHRGTEIHQAWKSDHPYQNPYASGYTPVNRPKVSRDMVRCGCGSVLKKSSLRDHLATKKHLTWKQK